MSNLRRIILTVFALVTLAACANSTPNLVVKAPVITPVQAMDVVKAHWDANHQADQSADPKVWVALETGYLETVDEKNTTNVFAGQHVTYDAVPIISSKVYLPRQTEYPAMFMAEIVSLQDGTDGHPSKTTVRWLWGFTATSKADGWKLMADTILPDSATLTFALDKDGYVIQTPDQATQANQTAAGMSSSYVNYMTSALASATTTSPFADGALTSDIVANYKTIKGEAHQSTLLTFTPQGDAQALTLADGGALVLFFATDQIERTAGAGYCFIQQPARTNFPYVIQPGSYDHVNFTAALELAALVPAKGSTAKISLSGFPLVYQGDTHSVPGTHAAGQC